MEKEIVLKINENEFNYLKGVLSSLLEIENKIPKRLKTENTNNLKSLYKKVEIISANL